jgi:hypothetical protein
MACADSWLAGSTPFRTSLKNYESPAPCVVFEYSFPDVS